MHNFRVKPPAYSSYQIYESSRFATETGAAIHVPPNAFGLLQRMGIDLKATGANPCNRITSYVHAGKQISSIDTTKTAGMWQHPWLLAHRVKLHDALKEAAISTSTPGEPAVLHLASPVAEIDPATATVHLKDGTSVSADVVLGADGVHSIARTKIPGGDVKPFGSGKSAFRFLVERKAVADDPQTAKYLQADGELMMAYGPDRRLVMYPTSDNTLLNFVCIHPESASAGSSTGDWNNKATKELLLEVYQDWHEDFRAILNKVDEKSLKVWRLLDMETLPSWTHERLALLGDAAHPFLPHQGQGGAIAEEDAVSLGVVLERGLKPEEVPERLKLYEAIRKSRAERLQEYTRLAGKDVKPGEVSVNMMEFSAFNYGHEEYDNSMQKLREWKWGRQPKSYWRMPVAFGPMPGPRQNTEGKVRSATQSTFVTASIKIKTSRTVLQNLFPPGSDAWRFKSPATVAYCSFSQTTLDGMEWLGGYGYNHLGLYIHGVEYTRKDGSTVSGVYMPILFESLADPIVSGREELGMPKLYSEIDVKRDASSYHIGASWRNASWGKFDFEDLEESNISQVAGKMTGDDTDEGILVQRYIPAVGREHKSQAEAEYAVYDSFAEAEPKPQTTRAWQSKNASFSIEAGDWKRLPTLHHVISRLAEIPVYEIVAAKVVEGTGVPDVSSAARI